MDLNRDARYAYREKSVLDIEIEGLAVRLWGAEVGPVTGLSGIRRLLERALRPLTRVGVAAPYVALLPDWHLGEGTVVGSVIPTAGAVLPTALGGDIGCGIAALPLPLDEEQLRPDLRDVRLALEDAVPAGRAWNRELPARVADLPLWRQELRAPVLGAALTAKLLRQLGSLGGGNHFLELRSDDEGRVWVLVHTGSRSLGPSIRDHYVRVAEQLARSGAAPRGGQPVLAAGTSAAADFLADQRYAVEWARANRREILHRVVADLARRFGLVAEPDELLAGAHDVCHDFVAVEEHFGAQWVVHRKGAASAEEGALGLVPGSMGSETFVVEGRGNPFSFRSASHGAGRRLTRAEARRAVSVDALRAALAGVEVRSYEGLRGEAPAAYKDVRRVLRAQHDLVRLRQTLRPLLVIKGVEGGSHAA